ncbi:ankyrin repeat domain-containing protein 11 isoform X4 [Bombyx mori]|uniref:ankyrin repeat domain-containing protein 11 isoform X4 n=1 Tax=Bombyx mori TaxID=7091 RepID=UPI00034FA0D4
MPSTSRTRGSGRGSDGSLRTQVIAPMSERQQLALVMQISSQDAPPAAPTPAEERKRTRQQRNERGETPLHVASIRGDHDQVKKLIDQGQDPDVPDFADSNARATHLSRARDDNVKKGNASGNSECSKRNNMETLAQGENFEGKDATSQEKGSTENRDESSQLSSGVVSSSQDDITSNKRQHAEDNQETDGADDEVSKRKKRKDEEKEPMGKPAPVARGGPGRKPPGPASKTGVAPLGKSGGAQGSGKGGSGGGSSGKSGMQSQGKGAGGKNKSSSSKGGSGSQNKQDRKSPVASPKPHSSKDNSEDTDDQKTQESSGPKVPPLKIVIPGGAGGSGGRNEQEGEGQRGSGKGRGSVSTLPYVIPCTSTDTGQTSDSSDGNSDDKRTIEGGKAGQRVLRSHRTNDDKDKERTSPHVGAGQNQLNTNKSPPPSSHDDHTVSTSSGSSRSEQGKTKLELHPRKRKLKSSKDHSRESKSDSTQEASSLSHNITHSNPYQMYIHIRKQIHHRQRGLFPVKPKPPKDFNKYLMNRCTYTLQRNVNPEPQIEIPHNLPPQMINEFMTQEKERHRLRIQHLVEKEKLVLAVEQEILRVHGRAERAVANQSLPFSVCTILRDREVYNVLAPEQEEKRNAQRSRCNGRQINSWLQEVDDKWEKIKEGMLRRQHTEAQTLHAVQTMGWEWKLKELGLCDFKTIPKIDTTHVPQIHVSNFDLPA